MTNMYENFYNTFLVEMPWKVNGSNDFVAQLEMLQENIQEGEEVHSVQSNIYKVILGNQTTYWVGDEDASKVLIIVDTEVSGNFCKVVLTSKNPSIPKQSPPYASDLYIAIQEDLSSDNLVLTSDSMMSDDAIRLWNRLHTSGRKISVYDTSQNKYVLGSIESAKDFAQYVGDVNYNKYIFVLSENLTNQRGLIHSFNIMEIKRLSLYPLFEQFKRNSI